MPDTHAFKYLGRDPGEIRRLLREPLRWAELEHRQQGKPSQKGNVQLLTYVQRKAIIDRLDHAVGFENWQDSYAVWTGGDSARCTLSLRIDGNWIAKEDGADQTDIEAVKGGITNAFKRAASKWGIGLYLYDMPDCWLTGEKVGDKVYAPRNKAELILELVRKTAPELLHPDDQVPVKAQRVVTNTETGERVNATTGEIIEAKPKAQPQLVKRHVEPPWLDEELDKGKFAGTRWRWFIEPSEDGARWKYLEWILGRPETSEWSAHATLCYLKRCTGQWYMGVLRNGDSVLSLNVVKLCADKGLKP